MGAVLMLTLTLFFSPLYAQQSPAHFEPGSTGLMGHPKVLFGEFLRDQIFDTSAVPYRIVGQVEDYCSGTLIGPQHILTAAHCVYDNKMYMWRSSHRFSPGKISSSDAPYGVVDWEEAYIHKKYADEGSSPYDFAVVKLKKPIGDELGWSGYGHLPDLVLPDDIMIVGYPGDKPKGTQWSVECSANFFGGTTFLSYRCDTFGGMSGSGVRYEYTDKEGEVKPYVIGVHILGSQEQGNFATFLNSENFALIKNWKYGKIDKETTKVHVNDGSSGQDFYKLYFENTCDKDIFLALHYKNLKGEWKTDSWYTVTAAQNGWVAPTRHKTFYFYAISKGGEHLWSGDSQTGLKVQLKGIDKPLWFKKKVIQSDTWSNWKTTFNCQ